MMTQSRFVAFFRICFTVISAGVTHAVEPLPPLTVLAERQLGEKRSSPIAEWSREEICQQAPRTIDELLAREPSFSLYRRQSSLLANPTSAGVSLRNTGASAASRTLVLLNGIPQNDPFGGWVYWARYDPATLDSVKIIPAAQSALWGNQSPAGVVQMNSLPSFGNERLLRAGGGGQGTLSGTAVYQVTNEAKSLSALFSTFSLDSEGFYAVDSAQRGTIDRKLDTSLAGADFKIAWQAAPGLTVEPSISWYSEDRGNGTPLTGNSSEAIDLALRISSVSGEISWQALAWQQRREFESIFSSVNPSRTSETLALDQYDVPATGSGGAFTMLWSEDEKLTFTSGLDARFVTGATHEIVGTFRNREAGGEQSIFGIFSAASFQATQETRLDGSVRLDSWSFTNSRRIEKSLSSGVILRNQQNPDRQGLEPSAALEISHQFLHDLVATLSVGTAFRLPTLNELHRPFRVRNDIVEANPELSPERIYSIASGIQWEPTRSLKTRLDLYHHWIFDAIANVPLTNLAQRQNVEQAQVTGLEAQVQWQPVASVNFDLSGIWSRSEFTASPTQPLLVGKPFSQAPDLRWLAQCEWQATGNLSFFAGCEYGATQFDDALATRELRQFTTARLGTSWRTASMLYQVRVENLFDEYVQTGLSSDGIRTIGAPRSLWVSVDWNF
jgi:outer membrane receptor protein involved in Fe transport